MFSSRHLLGHCFLHSGHSHGSAGSAGSPVPAPATAAQPIYYPTPTFNEESRYDPSAPFNLAPSYSLPKGFGLPLTRNFDYESFIKTTVGNNTETTETGLDLPLFIDLPQKAAEGSYQWDSFPAGEAQQFLVFSVARDLINDQPLYNGENFGATPVVLDAQSSSDTERPFTISLTVTPYNAGPIPHIHWAEDEWFIILQGEIDSWIGDPNDDAYELYEFPAGSEPLASNYDGPILTADNIDTFYYSHMTEGQAIYLPRGYAHSYRNASPTGDPLVFLTIWSRTPGYPEGGIEQFFTLPDPLIGRFYDTPNDAAGYGNMYNKNVGSTDGISNQQRLVDYYNTFPDYFVAMSRNFGSFASPESAGGNWNPAIPNDTTPFGTPPPGYWAPDSENPWLADSTTPGSEPYYLPPGPNAPSQSVSFATPLDPTVVQVSTFTYTGSNDPASVADFESQLASIESILTASDGVQYSLLLDPKSYSDSSQSYVLQTTWNTYSDLHEMQKSSELTSAMTSALQSSTLSTANNTVNSDLYAENQQMLIGRFQIKSEDMDQVLAISDALKTQTDQESGNISFDYYIDESDPNTIVYIEHYENGQALTAHLSASYTTAFFAELGPLTQSGLLADGNVGIYPVNSATSQFYPEQLNGLDLLGDILEGMPDLHLSLSVDKGKLVTSVPSGSDDIGGYINVTLTERSKRNKTYGYLDAESDKPVILFESDSSLNSKRLENILERKVAVTAGSSIQFFSSDQSAGDIIKRGLSSSAKLSRSRTLTSQSDGSVTFDGLQISLDVPYQGIEQVSSLLQTSAKPVIDLEQMPRRDISGSTHLYSTSGKMLCNSKEGSQYHRGLYQLSNQSGAIKDPVTGRRIKASDSSRYQSALADQIDSIPQTKLFTVEGGYEYAPFLEVDGKIYTPYNSDVKVIGSNSFLFDTKEGDYITSISFATSENVPLMA